MNSSIVLALRARILNTVPATRVDLHPEAGEDLGPAVIFALLHVIFIGGDAKNNYPVNRQSNK